MRKNILLLLYGLFFLSACGHWPPTVGNEEDILRLPSKESSFRVRKLPDEDLHALAHFDKLWYLDFGGGWGTVEAKITDQGLSNLSNLDLSNLELLTLSYNDNITDKGLKIISEIYLPLLEMLQLGNNPNITDEGIKHLQKMKSIQWLDLRGCPGLTDVGLKYLSEMPNLVAINLDDNPGITEEGLKYLMDMKFLKMIHLSGCEQISPDAARKFKEKLKMNRQE